MEDPQRQKTFSLLGLGTAWTRVGYGVLVLTIVALALLFIVHPFVPYNPKGATPEGYKLVGGEKGVYLKASPLGAASVFFLIFSALAALVWTLADIVDRRKRFVWLLPMFVCPFMGLHALPFALYLFYGRETEGVGDSV